MTAMLVVAADGARVGTTHVRCFDDGHTMFYFLFSFGRSRRRADTHGFQGLQRRVASG